jgi:hypothetical protein
MANIIITEEQLKHLIDEASIGDDITNLRFGNVAKGLKGVWRGEGYDYFSYLNTLKNVLRKLDKIDKPNESIMNDLEKIKSSLSSSKMPQNKKNNIINAIDTAKSHFLQYRAIIDQLTKKLETKLD